MAGWDDVLKEIKEAPSAIDVIRRKYLLQLHELTHRNVIAYYSGWLTKNNIVDLDINDNDLNGFMNAIKGLDCGLGLDLILHTPGGSPVAAEGIVKYLRSKFKTDIRIIVPQLAMSAGTMIACSSREIIMGKHSFLGPIDPQFNGIPAHSIRLEYENAKRDLDEHPENFNYWKILLSKYPAAFTKVVLDAIDLSNILATEWLGSAMFDSKNENDSPIIANIVYNLCNNEDNKSHGRHLDVSYLKSIGLKILELEADSTLQDAVLSVHHAFMCLVNSGHVIKIIENHNGKAIINSIIGKQ